MLQLLLFILMCYGATNIVVYGSIFTGFRNFWSKYNPSFFGKLVTCMMCLPFWWGFIASLTIGSPIGNAFEISDLTHFGFTIPSNAIAVFFDCCLASGTVWILHTVQEAFERHGTK